MNASTKLPVVYMDESGNKESDRFFVCGFLMVNNSEQLISELTKIRDQIEAKARFNKQKRIDEVNALNDFNQLYNFAKSPSNFELKYKHITQENLRLFKILLKILIHKVDFRLDALVIDRSDPSYIHTNLADMYKIITRLYFNHRCKNECIFVPDSFDHFWSWEKILKNSQIKAVIPGSSHSLLPLQIVDVLTGLIAQGLKDQSDYSNKDIVRAPLLKIFQEEANIKLQKTVTTKNPKYVSIWTVDFSKTNKKRSS